MSTTGDVLDSAQQAAFERYIRGGGGYVGVHSATDTEYDWPWYGQLVGAYFKRHPQIQDATRRRARPEASSPRSASRPCGTGATSGTTSAPQPPADAKILLTLDEKSYQGGTMGDVHPLSWYHTVDGGRAFYTELGHTSESYTDPLYLEHLARRHHLGVDALSDAALRRGDRHGMGRVERGDLGAARRLRERAAARRRAPRGGRGRGDGPLARRVVLHDRGGARGGRRRRCSTPTRWSSRRDAGGKPGESRLDLLRDNAATLRNSAERSAAIAGSSSS